MIDGFSISTIDEANLHGKRILLRADCDVSLHEDHTIANDYRIKSNLPTLVYLLERGNTLVIVAKLGKPHGREATFSLDPVVRRLKALLPQYSWKLIPDFLSEKPETFSQQQQGDVAVLENIRFYPQETAHDHAFAKKLASLADVYVNDAFAVSHREEASVTGVPHYIPGYAGLSLAREVNALHTALDNPPRPLVTIIGGAKIATKIGLIRRLLSMSDHVLIGGAIANTFLAAIGHNIGTSLSEPSMLIVAKELLSQNGYSKPRLCLPVDVITQTGKTYAVTDIPHSDCIVDIGPRTRDMFSRHIGEAGSIVWNGPMGMTEKKAFRSGTQAVYDALVSHPDAYSVVGGGDTITSLSHEANIERIDHISTGGGAMLEFIEKGTLPGLKALEESSRRFATRL